MKLVFGVKKEDKFANKLKSATLIVRKSKTYIPFSKNLMLKLLSKT